MTRTIIFDASALIGIFFDLGLPWLFDRILLLGYEAAVTSYVREHELKKPPTREAVDGLIAEGRLRLIDANMRREIVCFGKKHGLNLGESDVLLACQKPGSGPGDVLAVMDENDGRAVAAELGIPAIGLLGILRELKGQSLLTAEEAGVVNGRLQGSRFRAPGNFAL